MFTVSFLSSSTGLSEVSFFNNVRAARRHASWLSAQKWASDVRVYRGQAGEERLP